MRASDAKPVPQSTPLSPQTALIDSLPPWESNHASTAATTSAPSQTWDTPASTQNTASDFDFSLIWPDSENLFQSIMSTGTADQWQMPLGTLPFPPVVQNTNTMNFGSPNSFDDRSSSIGAIPSGGSHQAVRDVTEMVTSSVGFLMLLLIMLILILLPVLQRNSRGQSEVNHIGFLRRMSPHVLRSIYPDLSNFTQSNLCFSRMHTSAIIKCNSNRVAIFGPKGFGCKG